MHTPLQVRFVSLAHPSWRAYSRSRHPLLSMFLVLAPLTCQLREGFLRLFITHRRRKKLQRFSVRCNADFAQQRQVLQMTKRGSALIVVGICIGLFASFGATRLLASQI